MTDLYPTKFRLVLLDLVQRGEVVQYQWDPAHPSFWQGNGDGRGRGREVTARVAELAAAGWVELPELSGDHVEKWRLTEAGRQVLEAGRDA